MLLRSLLVRDFQALRETRIEGLADGLNVIVGDNEAGKSTLLTALRAGFFQRHGSKAEAVKAFRSYRGGGRPEVEIGFEMAGEPYRLRKAFIQKSEAHLSGPGADWNGDAADDRLSEMLGFEPPKGGPSKLSEHQGPFGLLWVEQGRLVQGLDVGAGRDALTAALEGEVGRMLGGERGRTLIDAARARRDIFFTDKGDKPRSSSPLRAAEERLLDLTAEYERLCAERDRFEEKLVRLSGLRRTREGYETDETVKKAAAAVEAAEAAVKAAEQSERDLADARRSLDHARLVRDGALERLNRRDAAVQQLAEARRVFEEVREAFATIDREAEAGLASVAEAQRDRASAQQREEEAEDRLLRAERLARQREERRDLAALLERVAKAEEVTAELVAAERERAGLFGNAGALQSLQAAERRAREAVLKRDVGAPTVRFRPSDRQTVFEEDRPVAPDEPQAVARPRRFILEGFGTLLVVPGESAADLETEVEEAERALAALLKRHEQPSVEAAGQAFRRRVTIGTEIDGLRKQLTLLVPEGLDEARRALQLAQERAEALGEELSEEAESLDRGALKEALDAARDAGRKLQVSLEATRRRSEELTIRRASAESDLRHREAELERLRAETLRAEEGSPRAELVKAFAEAEDELLARQAVLDRRMEVLGRHDPQGVRAELEQRQRAYAGIVETERKLADELLALETECRVEGANELGTRIAELEGEIETERRTCQRLTREASAARLLHDTLVAAERESRERWLGPIMARVAPFLRILDPDAEILLDEDTLEISGVRRGGVEEEFSRLSHGAREQVAVVARLGLADVLRRSGRPAAVILDDALVNTDEARLERMHRVLQAAGESLQVLVLTCRERDFRDLGAPVFRL